MQGLMQRQPLLVSDTIAPGERVGSLAWNGFRHLEPFYGVSGSGVIPHTIHPRLVLRARFGSAHAN